MRTGQGKIRNCSLLIYSQFLRTRVSGVFVAALVLLLATACGGADRDGENHFLIYYVDKEGKNLVSEEYEASTESQDTVELISELLGQLQTNGTSGRYRNPIEPEVELGDFQIKETLLSVYFTAVYNNKSGIDEILSRAAVVKTLCQVPGIEYVEFYVEDQPLMLLGNAAGQMNTDMFIEGLNPDYKEQSKQVVLYFSDESGQKLQEVTTEVTYSAAQPLAQMLMESLIAGPEQIEDLDMPDIKASIPTGTKVNSVTIRDNICYVDVSSAFLNQITEISSDVTIYSVVNTLCELPNVTEVQFTIEGEQQETYGETEKFNTPYERNLDLISDEEESVG